MKITVSIEIDNESALNHLCDETNTDDVETITIGWVKSTLLSNADHDKLDAKIIDISIVTDECGRCHVKGNTVGLWRDEKYGRICEKCLDLRNAR